MTTMRNSSPNLNRKYLLKTVLTLYTKFIVPTVMPRTLVSQDNILGKHYITILTKLIIEINIMHYYNKQLSIEILFENVKIVTTEANTLKS